MATNLLSFGPSGIRASASSGHRNPEANRRRSISSSSPSSTNWWAPLFGWSSEPDYFEPTAGGSPNNRVDPARSDPELYPKPSRSRFNPGCFTQEKAKQLRLLTNDTSSLHDAMYHSAIASRLASDFGARPE